MMSKKPITVKRKKAFQDKNGNRFCYNCNKYGYIVKRYLKPLKTSKNSDNGN